MSSSFVYEPPRHSSAFESIAAIAPTLSLAELRLVIDLTVNGSGSLREMARRTCLSLSSVKVAIVSLESRKLIEVRRGLPGEVSLVFATLPRVQLMREGAF